MHCRIAIACTKVLLGRNLGVTLTATSSSEQTQTEQEVPQSFSNFSLRPITSPIQEQQTGLLMLFKETLKFWNITIKTYLQFAMQIFLVWK